MITALRQASPANLKTPNVHLEFLKFPLFTYGQLCEGDTRPIQAWGEMRYIPGEKDAACKFGPEYIGKSLVYGQLHMKTMPELLALDAFERAPGKEWWDRRRITLLNNETAYAYYYEGRDWAQLERASVGIWLPST